MDAKLRVIAARLIRLQSAAMQTIRIDQTGALHADTLRRAAEESDLTWRTLSTLNFFRLVVAVILLSLYFASGDPRFFGDRYPGLFAAAAAGYLVFAALGALAIRLRLMPSGPLLIAQVAVDIVAVVTLMHASGGITSGLGGLLVVFVGASAVLLPMQAPAFFAALATLAVLSEQAFSQLVGLSTNYSAAGVLGAIIFAIALAARPLARRLQASEALARQRGIDLANLSELNEYIVQHLRESIVVVDHDDRIRLINSSAESLLGLPGSGSGLPIVSVSEPLWQFLQTWRDDPHRSAHADLTFADAEHAARVYAHIAPLGRDDARSGPVLIFLEDASVINARVQKSKLASLGRLSASIAHEIRNPVGAMSHAGQLLAESESLAPEDLRLTEIIRSHAERVSLIIENVLQLSRREAVAAEELELGPWLADFSSEFERTLELHENELSVAPVEAGLVIRMDPGHLRQVLWNLCDNAVKYASETGGIHVELRAGRSGQGGRPYVEVLDRGHGVDPAIADKIFEPFFTDRQGGTGLGLYISRELCELNGATLVYQPRDGGGSLFRIVFAEAGRWQMLADRDERPADPA